jgi:hypothetical protein
LYRGGCRLQILNYRQAQPDLRAFVPCQLRMDMPCH